MTDNGCLDSLEDILICEQINVFQFNLMCVKQVSINATVRATVIKPCVTSFSFQNCFSLFTPISLLATTYAFICQNIKEGGHNKEKRSRTWSGKWWRGKK